MSSLAWVPLPTPGAPRRRTGPGTKFSFAGAGERLAEFIVNGIVSLPALAATDAAALGSEAVVVTHDELCFDLLDCVHGDTEDDQQRGAAEVEVDAEAVGHPSRQAVEDGTDKPE